jgi:uncharacterized membrane protein
MTAKFSKGEAIRFGWETTKSNFWFFVVVLIIGGLLSVASNIIKILGEGWGVILSIVYFVLGILFLLGLIKISLKFCDKEKGKLSDLFSQYHLFFKFLFASILYCLIVAVGMILLIVPGLIWGIKFSFYPYFIVDKGLGPIEALRRSSTITKGSKWNLFVFFLIVSGINLLGALCLLIGLFATIPTTRIARAFVYRKLLAQTETIETKFDVNNDQQVF